jgi:pyruvate,water dikinase
MKKRIILRGIPASSGKVKGRVKILLSSIDVLKIKKGDILVAPETNPEYTIAIIKSSAIVTDHGGILSHPAIVSREMGIPGVVGTEVATQILKDGMEVIVDGTKGVVLG